MAIVNIPDDYKPDDLEVTTPTGGLDRMIKLWEMSRDLNEDGYGGGVLQKVRNWSTPSKRTSCSPFTATVIGMMFDSNGGEDATKLYQPKYRGGTLALPSDFYALHNGYYFSDTPGPKRKAAFLANKWPLHANDSAPAIVFFNLGYEIDPRDMRRGDFVGINWGCGDGHATFCWDVHLDANGAVDCFSFLSSNGTIKDGKYTGYGVSLGTQTPDHFIDEHGGQYKKKSDLFVDKPDNIKWANWYCLAHVQKASVDIKTFKQTPGLVVASGWTWGVGSLRVVRFYGFPPPESPHGAILSSAAAAKAREVAKWSLAESYASGNGTPSKNLVVKGTQSAPVPKTNPEPVKAAPTAPPAKQPTDQVVDHQHFVENTLAQLHAAGWLTHSPGKTDSIADTDTKAAVEEFQKAFNAPPVDGIAGPVTRAALIRALDDLHAGKPKPHGPPPKPTIDHFYWSQNHADPGGECGVAIHGAFIERFDSFELILSDQTAKQKTRSLGAPLAGVGFGLWTIAIPGEFAQGSVLTAKVRGHSGGAITEKSSEVPLYVGSAVPQPQTDWPWDESTWTPQMRNVVAELRSTTKGPGDFHKREITQYGVKEKIASGDTPVLDKAGRELGRVDKASLFRADIEGTMRLDGRILNICQSGNVYDQQVTRDIGGTTVRKPKPSLAKFDPSRSRWVDVTDRAPWGMGARMPLIPFRVLAHNPRTEVPLYGRIVYITQLDGLTLPTGETHNGMCIVGDCGGMAPPASQFDFFVGREDHHIAIPTIAPSQGGAVCEVEILGASSAWQRRA